jgi:hypothetical protein
MADTNWIKEHTTAAALGGLSSDEATRFENYADAESKKAADELRAFDASLQDIFAPVWSGQVEVASVSRLRQDWTRTTMERGWQRKLAYGLAASIGLGITGAGVSMMGGLPMPGEKGFSFISNEKPSIYRESKPSTPSLMVDGFDGQDAVRTHLQQGADSQTELAFERDKDRAAVQFFKVTPVPSPDQLAKESLKELSDATLTKSMSDTARLNNHLDSSGSAAPKSDFNSWQLGFRQDIQVAPRGPVPGATPAAPGGVGTPDGFTGRYVQDGKDVTSRADLPALNFAAPNGEVRDKLNVPANPQVHEWFEKKLGEKSEDGLRLHAEAERVAKDAIAKNDTVRVVEQNKFLGGIEAKPKSAESLYALPVDPAWAVVVPVTNTPQPPPNNTTGQEKTPANAPAAGRKIIIRSGDIEFEVESFDGSVANITKLVLAIPGAFVGTVNSEKLPNGKVKGSVVVRVPPEHLDAFVLDLRRDLGKGGELKGQRIGSSDVTKQYTDLESRLRAARTMETRLLEIIKTGKGEIKQLLEAEKELGVWRTKIEEIEGELRYLANMASLSTLTITLAEKEIRTAAALTESERVTAGVEVEDVEAAYRALQTAISEAKGRVSKAEMKQHSPGQFAASLVFEVAPEAAGPLRDRLKQLGTVARINIDRQQTSDGQPVTKEAKIKRGDTVFDVQIYNLLNVKPRETTTVSLAVANVATAFATIREAVTKAGGRILSANLNEGDRKNVTAQVDFEIKRADEAAVRTAVQGAGEMVSRQTVRSTETENTTDSKVLYRATLFGIERVAPRETTQIGLAVPNVPAEFAKVRDAVTKLGGRILMANLNEQDQKNVTAQLDFEIKQSDDAAIRTLLEGAGDVITRSTNRAGESEMVTDSKVAYRTKWGGTEQVPPKERTVLASEVADVDNAVAVLNSHVNEANGKKIDETSSRDRGKVTTKVIYQVPLAAASSLAEKVRGLGVLRVSQSSRDTSVSDGKYATARFEVTLSNEERIIAPEDGLWPQVRKGLSYSASVLLTSVTWVVFGLCVVLPWALLGYGGYRLIKRMSPAKPANA